MITRIGLEHLLRIFDYLAFESDAEMPAVRLVADLIWEHLPTRPLKPEDWDLSTIPDPIWASEQGRRSRAKGPAATNIKLEACRGCNALLNARQRRKACPHCGVSQRTGKCLRQTRRRGKYRTDPNARAGS